MDAMTNEELAVRIKAGEKQLVGELYERTQKLLTHYAKRHGKLIRDYPDLSMDDLIQCGYFAFMKAIASFDPDKKHEFHSYILFKYKHEVDHLLGKHRENGQYFYRPAVYSLNEKEVNAEDAPEKLDMLIDESSGEFIAEHEQKELAALMEAAIEGLPAAERSVIIQIYYFNRKKTEIAKERNVHHQSIARLENHALDLLSVNTALRDYYYSAYSPEVCSSGF